MTDRPEDVIREARGDYIVGMRSQGYRAESVARLVAEFDAALSALITERDELQAMADAADTTLARTAAERDRLRETLRFIGWEMHDPAGVVLDARRLAREAIE